MKATQPLASSFTLKLILQGWIKRCIILVCFMSLETCVLDMSSLFDFYLTLFSVTSLNSNFITIISEFKSDRMNMRVTFSHEESPVLNFVLNCRIGKYVS